MTAKRVQIIKENSFSLFLLPLIIIIFISKTLKGMLFINWANQFLINKNPTTIDSSFLANVKEKLQMFLKAKLAN